MRDSSGKSGTDETRKAFRRFRGPSDEEVGDYAGQAQRPPTESEHPETEINYPQAPWLFQKESSFLIEAEKESMQA
ncbi:hypothetical protein [Fictibacillus fluitans]|uniref:Uncharacterized protein n=1 Tax=Fictibacillus fluitans TaxID=3058422 RepID=A0ABT8HWV1_9BACL|nr:hypothetical protein [Fictibacillus sp. NE201]MDN4524732.1 hypothetical protein [Fictibacillus sp. NE201]